MASEVSRAVASVERYLSGAPFSGVVRISSGEEVLLEHASGLANRADGVPNLIDTRFGLASVTKAFTAAAVCRLVDQGTATFGSRIVDLLPEDKRPSTLSGAVTLHHLLTHTSGIADYFDEVNLGAAAYDQVWLDHPSYMFRQPADFLPLFIDLPPLREPGGSAASYCNAGFILLGLVIEELSGSRNAEYVEQEIFRAAGMSDSGFFALDEVRERVAIGYVELADGTWKTNSFSIPILGGPDGGAFSTTRDLATFLNALPGGVFFGSETWKLMSTPHVSMDDISYGFGLNLFEHGRTSCFGHGGADPGFSARAYRYPELDLDVAMLGNTINETDAIIETFRSGIEALS